MRIAVVSPTYNERENIGWFLDTVRASLPQAEIFIIDDNSPDGTGVEADRLAAELGNITVVHRFDKKGLGSAYRHGFGVAIDAGFDAVVSMDVDRSHDPSSLPAMIAALAGGADIVVGSRYVPGGSTVNWPLHRRLLSSWGNRYTTTVLGLHVGDCTSAYRAYRADVLEAVEPNSTRAEGYAFLTELLRRAQSQGRVIVEVPIRFVDRDYGDSKMSGRIIAESMLLVTGWGVSDTVRKARRRFSRRGGNQPTE